MLTVLRPLLFLLLLIGSFAHASEEAIAAQIIDKTLGSLFKSKSVKAWGDTPKQQAIIGHSKTMIWVESPQEADFIIIAEGVPSQFKANCILFGTDYDMLEQDARVIGAFYWQKGRPNLIFLRERLREHNLTLSSDFEKYIEDAL